MLHYNTKYERKNLFLFSIYESTNLIKNLDFFKRFEVSWSINEKLKEFILHKKYAKKHEKYP